MRIVIDIECNALRNPSKIWVVVCRQLPEDGSKDIDTGTTHIFRKVTEDAEERTRFLAFISQATLIVGHNILEYDLPVLRSLLQDDIAKGAVTRDTLILSRLIDYSRVGGHSIEQYGTEFGLEKIDVGKAIAGHNPFFNQYSLEMEEYCVRDVDIAHRIYLKYLPILSDPSWSPSIELEHRFQLIVNDLHNNGFCFDTVNAKKLLARVEKELKELDDKILDAFPPREVLIREFTPKLTKYGTISKSSVPRTLRGRIHEYEAGRSYRHTKTEPFNPSSHKQLIEVLNNAGWRPTDKTATHIDTERELAMVGRANRSTKLSSPIGDDNLSALKAKLEILRITGWQINEVNLATLPDTAPEGARLLAKRILLEARRRSLTEWLGLVQEDGRVHGKFVGLGSWTGRMSHQKPNTANIPNSVKIADGSTRLLGKEMRELWCAPKNRLLVGVDAEAIQFRIFAHMIEDKNLIKSILSGKKSDKTDPHSLNQVIFGHMCKTRNAAKHSMFALFFGGRANKISQIMGCSKAEAEEAIQNLLDRYPGLADLERRVFPNDARRGYFIGLDGRQVKIPGDTVGAKKHLCMSGYLQNGEKIIMAKAAIILDDKLSEYKADKKWMLIAIVHDALDSEVKNDWHFAEKIAKVKAEAIKQAGEELGLKCPMAGAYINDDTKKLTIGKNWYVTH